MRSREDDARVNANIYGEDTIIEDIAISFGRIADMLSEMNGYIVDYDDGQKKIEALPKRETGKWIKLGRWGRNYKCNRCNNSLDLNGVNAGRENANYCPNYGAKMSVEESN